MLRLGFQAVQVGETRLLISNARLLGVRKQRLETRGYADTEDNLDEVATAELELGGGSRFLEKL